MKKLLVVVMCCMLVLCFSVAVKAGTSDVKESPTPYFVPSDSLKGSSPYYRWYGEDWGWTHGAISETIDSSATLSISAYDVDYDSGERDKIFAWDTDASSWVWLGYLTGVNNAWSYGSVFTIPTSLYNEIGLGLQVWMEIDSTDDGWAVTLAKSVLTVDGGYVPPPQPGRVPEPATMILLGLGLVGITALKKKL